MKRFLVLTLPAFVVSCERVDVREYEAPKETFPQKAAVREQIEQAQNSARDLRNQFEGASGLATRSLRRRCGKPALSSREQTGRRWIFL